MKLTEKQAIMLLDIAKGSLSIAGTDPFGYDHETRAELVSDILDQFDEDLVEFGKLEKKES